MKRAYTLTELMVVVFILLALTALLFPVISRVKTRMSEFNCATKLHQIYEAIKVYQDSYEGAPVYGRSDVMGLPPSAVTLVSQHLLPPEVFRCGGRGYPYGAQAVFVIMWMANIGEPYSTQWTEYCAAKREESALIVDPNHDRAANPRSSPYTTHHATALLLNGNLKTVDKRGVPTTFDFWK